LIILDLTNKSKNSFYPKLTIYLPLFFAFVILGVVFVVAFVVPFVVIIFSSDIAVTVFPYLAAYIVYVHIVVFVKTYPFLFTASCTKETRYLVSRREVDIVVITSEGTNMKFITDRLPKLISRLNINLETKSINPRFGLVGFNGRPQAHWKGHTHTLDGKFFGSSNDLSRAGSTFDFAPSSLKTNISDGYMGIYHATKYPFRPAAKKVFILLTDSPRVPDSQLTSDVVSEAMKSINAKLIVVGDYQ
jgi:hypothetical protein